MVKKAIALWIFFALISCKYFVGEDENLTIACAPFRSDELRIDGYYHEGEITPETITTVYFFYRNGTLCSPGSYSGQDFYKTILEVNEPAFVEKRKASKIAWGVFQIDKKEIVFEKWYPLSGSYAVYQRKGIIINDSTFIIDEVVGIDDSIKNFRKEIYHFKQFKQKPDSTNDFVVCQ